MVGFDRSRKYRLVSCNRAAKRLPAPANVVCVGESIEIVPDSGPVAFCVCAELMRRHEPIDRSSSIQHFAHSIWCVFAILSTIAKAIGSLFKVLDVPIDFVFLAGAIDSAAIESLV